MLPNQHMHTPALEASYLDFTHPQRPSFLKSFPLHCVKVWFFRCLKIKELAMASFKETW